MKIDVNKVKIGADFELFIVDNEKNFISAIPFIDGTKESPLPVSPVGHAIQHDGALAEANVPPVLLFSNEEMWENIQLVTEAIKERLPTGLEVLCCPNGEYKDDQLQDEEARRFGCDPDFSAWNGGEINEKPDANETNKRCCGYHVHISFPGASPANVMRLVRLLDVNIALPFLFIDEDKERRNLYGKAGCFRFKDYGEIAGVEYRSLSNSVIKDKETFNFFWDGLIKAIKDYNEGLDYLAYEAKIQEAINTYNLDIANELVEEFNIKVLENA